MTFFLLQKWNDDRFKNTSSPQNDFEIYRENSWDLAWKPDTYLANEMPNGLVDTTPADYLRIYNNGTLFQSRRHSVVFHCNVLFFKIPVGDEICTMKFKSSSFSTKDLQFQWAEQGIRYASDFIAFVVKISKTEQYNCTGESDDTDNHPCIGVKLYLRRIHQTLLLQVYFPSICIVFITWLGFWIHHKEVSGRTRIATISFTAMIAESLASMVLNPDMKQMEAIQVWNSACMALVTLACLEFVIVHNIQRRLSDEDYETEDSAETIAKIDHIKHQHHLEYVNQPNGDVKTKPTNRKTTNIANHTMMVNGKTPQNKIYPQKENPNITIIDVSGINSDKSDVESNTSRKIKKRRCISPERVDMIGMVIYAVLFLLFVCTYWSYFIINS